MSRKRTRPTTTRAQRFGPDLTRREDARDRDAYVANAAQGVRQGALHEAGPVQTDEELWRYAALRRPPYGSQHV